MAARALQGEPILLTTPPLLPEPTAVSQDAAMVGAARLDSMEANVKAIQQQAQVTHKTLEQLRAREADGSDGVVGTELPLAEAAWTVAAVMLAYTLLHAWQQWRRRAVAVPEPDDESFLPSQNITEKAAPTAPPPPVVASRAAVQRAVAIEPEFADASDSDWGVSHSVELDEQAGFDVRLAASEVARVRNALAQRRQARALERAEDARRARALTERARRRAEEFPAWDDSRPFPEVLDVACDDAVASAAMLSAPAPFWQQPSQRAAMTDACDVPVTIQPELEREDQDPNEDEGGTLPALDNAYAVKLALAYESAAVDLWDEARELIHEVLESGDPTLQAEAHALLARIAQRENEAHGDGG